MLADHEWHDLRALFVAIKDLIPPEKKARKAAKPGSQQVEDWEERGAARVIQDTLYRMGAIRSNFHELWESRYCLPVRYDPKAPPPMPAGMEHAKRGRPRGPSRYPRAGGIKPPAVRVRERLIELFADGQWHLRTELFAATRDIPTPEEAWIAAGSDDQRGSWERRGAYRITQHALLRLNVEQRGPLGAQREIRLGDPPLRYPPRPTLRVRRPPVPRPPKPKVEKARVAVERAPHVWHNQEPHITIQPQRWGPIRVAIERILADGEWHRLEDICTALDGTITDAHAYARAPQSAQRNGNWKRQGTYRIMTSSLCWMDIETRGRRGETEVRRLPGPRGLRGERASAALGAILGEGADADTDNGRGEHDGGRPPGHVDRLRPGGDEGPDSE